MELIGTRQQLFGSRQLSGEQRRLTEDQSGKRAAGNRPRVLGDRQEFPRGSRDSVMAAGAAETELGEAEMPVEDIGDELRRRADPGDELRLEELLPPSLHVCDQTEQRARLADLASKAGVEGECAG